MTVTAFLLKYVMLSVLASLREAQNLSGEREIYCGMTMCP